MDSFVAISLVLIFVAASSSFTSQYAAAVPGAEYNVTDRGGTGRIFNGIGAISAKASSKLLKDYLEPYRTQILDYLFKPMYAASLHILKVEIGGDSQSTDGTESSHMHTQFEENYNRGYEWWIMKEAKKRNENIKLYGLAWAFPGWLNDHPGSKTPTPYGKPKLFVKYLVNWVVGAKKYHNLTIDYLGIWNERTYNITAIKMLRRGLDAANQSHVEIVAADGGWDIANDMQKDKELSNSIAVIGAHYPGTYSSSTAKATNKPLWASEDYSTFNDDVGGGCWARTINQNYINGEITASIAWNLVSSYYDGLPFTRSGLLTANQPWQGHYEPQPPMWMTAHTTQFSLPNWSYLAHGRGVGLLKFGGSYVSLTDSQHLTIVVETIAHNNSRCMYGYVPPYNVSRQMATFVLGGTFANISKLHYWWSILGENQMLNNGLFGINVTNSRFTVQLLPNMVYTFTTVRKEEVVGPYWELAPPHAFSVPYSDDFTLYEVGAEPRYLVSQVGTFEVAEGKILKQMVTKEPVYWCGEGKSLSPLAVIGDAITNGSIITIKVLVPSSDNATAGVFVAQKVATTHAHGNFDGCQSHNASGIFFWLFPSVSQVYVSTDIAMKNIIYERFTRMQLNTWIHISLSIYKSNYSISLDDNRDNFMVIEPIPAGAVPIKGYVALGTSDFGVAHFDDLCIFC